MSFYNYSDRLYDTNAVCKVDFKISSSSTVHSDAVQGLKSACLLPILAVSLHSAVAIEPTAHLLTSKWALLRAHNGHVHSEPRSVCVQ